MTDDQFEVIFGGTSDMATELLHMFAEEFRSRQFSTRVEKVKGDFGDAFDVRLSNADHTIGRLKFVDLPGGRVLVRSLFIGKPEHDPDGSKFKEFCEYLVRRAEGYGLLARRQKFACSGMVDTAIRQLAAADTPEGFASIGNVCRTALIALSDELFNEAMLAVGEDQPRGDAAGIKLKVVARFNWGARSSNQLDGIKKEIDGTWDMAAAFLHRKNATREEAEIVVTATTALFDIFSLMVP